MGRSRRRAGGGVSGEVAAEETEARRRELRRGGADIARKEFTSRRHWARDWRALALTQVHNGSRLSDSCEDGEALSSLHLFIDSPRDGGAAKEDIGPAKREGQGLMGQHI